MRCAEKRPRSGEAVRIGDLEVGAGAPGGVGPPSGNAARWFGDHSNGL